MSAERRTETVIARTPHDGWFWVIPMANDVHSVGVVARPEALGDIATQRAASWSRQVAMTPWIADLLGDAEPSAPIRAVTDLSYRSRYCADDGVVLLGDAFGFLDPVFSAGVFLAMRTGEVAADSVIEALKHGRTDAACMVGYGEAVCAGVEQTRALVYSFYNPEFSMGKLARAHPELVGDITDVLIGDLFKPHDELIEALRALGTVPPPVPHGRARL
jgi:flavin-dependent dehydrogenase